MQTRTVNLQATSGSPTAFPMPFTGKLVEVLLSTGAASIVQLSFKNSLDNNAISEETVIAQLAASGNVPANGHLNRLKIPLQSKTVLYLVCNDDSRATLVFET